MKHLLVKDLLTDCLQLITYVPIIPNKLTEILTESGQFRADTFKNARKIVLHEEM